LSDDAVGEGFNPYQTVRAKHEYFNAKLAELEYMKKYGVSVFIKDSH